MTGLKARFHIVNDTEKVTVIPTQEGTFNILGTKYLPNKENATHSELEEYKVTYHLVHELEYKNQLSIFDI